MGVEDDTGDQIEVPELAVHEGNKVIGIAAGEGEGGVGGEARQLLQLLIGELVDGVGCGQVIPQGGKAIEDTSAGKCIGLNIGERCSLHTEPK